jgi:hypothetical protein
MIEKILRRKGASEGAPKEEKVGPQEAAKPQEFTPTAEGVPMAAAMPEAQGQESDSEVATEVGDLRAYAPAIELESLPLATLVEPGDDMREIVKEYAEADRLAAEEKVTVDSTQEEDADETDLGPVVEKRVVEAFRESFRKTDDAKEDAACLCLDEFFDGNLDLSKNPSKHTSLKRVQKELKNEISPQAISSRVRAADIRRKRKAVGKNLPNVTFSHDVELVAVEDEEKRMELAESINRSPISIAATRKRVREINAKEAPGKDLKRVIRKLKDPLSLPGGREFEDLLADPEKLEKDLSKRERKDLLTGITVKKQHIKTSVKRMEELVEWLEEIDPPS